LERLALSAEALRMPDQKILVANLTESTAGDLPRARLSYTGGDA
jgi:hypothetical protein